MKEYSSSHNSSMLGRDVNVKVIEVVVKKRSSSRGSEVIFETRV